MPKFLFWNVCRLDRLSLVKEIAHFHEVDVILLAESKESPFVVQDALNNPNGEYRYADGACKRIQFYTRFSDRFLVAVSESDKYSIRRLKLPARSEILLVGAHLPSQMYASVNDITQECRYLSNEIEKREKLAGHMKTILLGDFNLNPFDEGLVQAGALHAVGSRRTALRGNRTVQGRRHSFFYNPMWAHLGDREDDTAGTYYYGKGRSAFFWNVFDQVLLRPELVRTFSHEQVEVIKRAGEQDLLKADGRPNSKVGSDHLPVLLNLDF